MDTLIADPADAPNPARASRFHAARQRRRVGDPCRSAAIPLSGSYQRIRSFLAAIGFLVLGIQNHQGQFLEGRTMTLRWLFGGVELPGLTVSFAVDSTPGKVEVTDWGDLGSFSIDVFDTDETHASIIISCHQSVGFGDGTWQFADTNQSLPDFGILCVDSTHWGWMYQERFSVSADTIDIKTFYAYGYTNDFVRLDITREVTARLAIEFAGPSRVAISWPTNASHYVLESANTLSSYNWTIVEDQPDVVDQRFALTLDTTNMHRVFRLHKR